MQEVEGMGTKEIKSPGSGQETPAATASPYDGISADLIRRKKLGIYFIESDDRRTAFGRGYTGGTTPVNIHGMPIPDLSKTGGWTAAFFIFGNKTMLLARCTMIHQPSITFMCNYIFKCNSCMYIIS